MSVFGPDPGRSLIVMALFVVAMVPPHVCLHRIAQNRTESSTDHQHLPGGSCLYGRRRYGTMAVGETDPSAAAGSPEPAHFAQASGDLTIEGPTLAGSALLLGVVDVACPGDAGGRGLFRPGSRTGVSC
ncbi:MAG: hypothetical protein ACOC84_00065 [Actinomycetota bacterium]